jgi:hypothetical protein
MKLTALDGVETDSDVLPRVDPVSASGPGSGLKVEHVVLPVVVTDK